MNAGSMSREEMGYLIDKFSGDDVDRLFSTGLLAHPGDAPGPRQHMFSIHYAQHVMLNNPDTPRYFTGYEKTFGKYLTSFHKAAKNYEIIAKIVRHSSMPNMSYLLVIKEIGKNHYDTIKVSHYEKLSESHGYLRPFTHMDEKTPGAFINRDDMVFKTTTLDGFGNYKYGKNLKTAFLLTPEVKDDSVVVSEKCAMDTTFNLVTTTGSPIGKGDIMLNLFGDFDDYKSFMNVGETVPDAGVLFAVRKIEKKNISSDCTTSALSHMCYGDNKYQGSGVVVDIDIKVNDIEELNSDIHREQLLQIYNDQYRYNKEIYDVLSPLMANKNNCSQRLEQELFNATNYINPGIKYSSNTGNFEFAYLTIYTAYETPLIEAIKTTNRCGAKAVIGKIAPEEYMPVNSDGIRADIICSSSGIINRGNVDQLKEQMTNYASDCIVNRAKKEKSVDKSLNIITDYLKMMSPEWGDYVSDSFANLTLEQKTKRFENICIEGLYMYNPPMNNSISFELLKKVSLKYKLTVSKVKMCRDYHVSDDVISLYDTKENIEAIKNITENYTFSSKKTVEGKGKNKTTSYEQHDFSITDINPSVKNKLGLKIPEYKENAWIDDYTWSDDEVSLESMSDETNGDVSLSEYISSVQEMLGPWDASQLENEDPSSFEITKSKVFKKNENTLTREFVSKYPVIIADVYFMILRQIPSAAFSARSLGSMSPLGLPNKSLKKSEVGRPYGDTANQFGEMETADMMKLCDPQKVSRYLATHSTNPDMRSELAGQLMLEDPTRLHDLPYSDDEIRDTVPVRMHNAYLASIGLETLKVGERDPYAFLDDIDMTKTTLPKLLTKAGMNPEIKK